MFINDPEDWSSISGRVIPKTQKIVLNASLLNTQYYEILIKGKWNNPEKVAHTLHLSVVAIEKGPLKLPTTRDSQQLTTNISYHIWWLSKANKKEFKKWLHSNSYKWIKLCFVLMAYQLSWVI